jgi:hypothetical protein
MRTTASVTICKSRDLIRVANTLSSPALVLRIAKGAVEPAFARHCHCEGNDQVLASTMSPSDAGRLSNVHNGLVEVGLCGPTASGRVARTLAPEGKLTSIGVVAVRIPLMSSDGFLVRAPAERFASAPDAVQDNC